LKDCLPNLAHFFSRSLEQSPKLNYNDSLRSQKLKEQSAFQMAETLTEWLEAAPLNRTSDKLLKHSSQRSGSCTKFAIQ